MLPEASLQIHKNWPRGAMHDYTSWLRPISLSYYVIVFMYCRPATGNIFYFINKVLLFYRYMRNGSRVMMQCLYYIKTYINGQYSLSRTEIKFYLTPESNTIFCPSQISL